MPEKVECNFWHKCRAKQLSLDSGFDSVGYFHFFFLFLSFFLLRQVSGQLDDWQGHDRRFQNTSVITRETLNAIFDFFLKTKNKKPKNT